MNIDSILTEWCFRLPNGYPSKSKDYEVLYDVLIETSDISPNEARAIVKRAQGTLTKMITEAVQFDSIENTMLINAINQSGKTDQFKRFLRLLPVEAENITLTFLNNCSAEQAEQFANLLYSQSDVSEDNLNSIDFRSGIAYDLFKLEPKGLGKGEIYLAALIEGARLNGSTVSFDMSCNGKFYEIKDYTGGAGNAKSIRLGTKAAVTRFKFWDEIQTTLKRIDQLRGPIENPKFNFHKYFNESLLSAIAYLDDRRSFQTSCQNFKIYK